MKNLYEDAMDICKNEMEDLQNAIQRIIELGYLGKEEGLLSLENYIECCDEFEEKRFLQHAIECVVDGDSWENVNEFLSNRILLMDNRKKQYFCMIYKEGIRIIQNGMFFGCIKKSISSLVPEAYEEKILEYVDEVVEQEAEKWYQKRVQMVTQKYHELDDSLQKLFANEMKVFESVLQFLPNHSDTQDWLRQMYNEDVCILMMVGSNTFRETILSNMSSRLKIEIMDEIVKLTEIYKTKEAAVLHDVVKETMQKALECL